MAGKARNDLLASWFARSGWSQGELARLVNRRARELGAPQVSTDTSRVRRWLEGEQPRDPIPRILTELFSERLGRVVSTADLGLRETRTPPHGAVVDARWTPDATVDLLTEVTRSDLVLTRRGAVTAGTPAPALAGSALVKPVKRWVDPSPAVPRPRVGAGAGRVSNAMLDQIDLTIRQFRSWDAQCGGWLRRPAAVGQLQSVVELLRDGHSERLTRKLFDYAAQLALLAGWMSYDVGMQQAAQRYFVLALRAARESGDRALGANVLAVMCRQMIHLNRPQDALELLALARYGARGALTAGTRSMVCALEARAQASLGQAQAALRAIGAAEDQFALRLPADEPPWIGYFTEAELAAESGHAYRDLAYVNTRYARPAVERIGQAVLLFHRNDTEHVRSRALSLVGLASAHLIQGEPEGAVHHAAAALDLTDQVRSTRLDDRLRITTAALHRRFGAAAEVRDLAERIRARLPEPSC